MKLFETLTINVQADRISFVVKINPAFDPYSNESWVSYLTERYPELPYHQCLNDEGQLFGAVLHHTDLAHVLEHLIISEQVRSLPSSSTYSLLGTTRWVDEGKRIARIDVNYLNDLQAIKAFSAACTYMEGFFEGVCSNTKG